MQNKKQPRNRRDQSDSTTPQHFDGNSLLADVATELLTDPDEGAIDVTGS